MIGIDISSSNKKRKPIKITNIDDFKEMLKQENYVVNESCEGNFKRKVAEIFEVNLGVVEMIYEYLKETDITYRANNSRDFIDYIEKMVLFEYEHKKISEKLSKIKKLIIDRIEYERERTPQYIGEDIINDVEKIRKNISRMTIEEEKMKLESIEEEIENNYLYAKDIELLKKMIISSKNVKEEYNEELKIKTIVIEMPKEINSKYIPAYKGSIEYHNHLSNNIPRIKRLIKNIDKYMKKVEEDDGAFKINQSTTFQDSINIAVAIFNNKEFKAISGSIDIDNYCISPSIEESFFESCKVNKLGKLGVGYNRVYDSEKKILEEIHKQIEEKVLRNEGNLILYTKWEPCPSCYYVISQFCRRNPNIKVQVKYIKKYGEK